jgi:tRNA-binding protein
VPAGSARYHPRALASLDDVLALDIRVGTIVAARINRGTRRPSYALTIDFGGLGRRSSSAPIADLYDVEDLVGLQVFAVVNLPAKRVASLDSEVLVLSVDDGRGDRVLAIPERPVPDGGKLER